MYEHFFRPVSTSDVAAAVRAARSSGLEVSVRSGGHSYTCQSIKEGGIHFDLRRLNKIEVVDEGQVGILPLIDLIIKSTCVLSCPQVLLGSGAQWKAVKEVLPPSKFSYVHGQCGSVGVGGFLLGGGVNPATSARYGFGADNVDEYTVVTANGSVVKVGSKL